MLNPKSVNVIHLLLIGPFLVYVGLNGKKASSLTFNILTGLGLLVMVYHGYKLYEKMNKDISPHVVGGAIKNTIDNVRNQIVGKDNAGNNVVVDQSGNVAVVDKNGTVVAMNDDNANRSANQAMANNA